MTEEVETTQWLRALAFAEPGAVAGIHVKSGSQSSVTPVLEHLEPSALHLNLHSYGAYACIQANTVTYKIFLFLFGKKWPLSQKKKNWLKEAR